MSNTSPEIDCLISDIPLTTIFPHLDAFRIGGLLFELLPSPEPRDVSRRTRPGHLAGQSHLGTLSDRVLQAGEFNRLRPHWGGGTESVSESGQGRSVGRVYRPDDVPSVSYSVIRAEVGRMYSNESSWFIGKPG